MSADQSQPLGRPGALEIKIGNVPLWVKLDVIGACLAEVKRAHRDTMPERAWDKICDAQDALGAATIAAAEGVAPRISDAPATKSPNALV